MFQNFENQSDGASGAARLKMLRTELAARGLDGFLVPRADAHQGENVAACDERLRWICGFTGSAGLVIVLKDRAALFVDGRYTLQAADQADTESFEIVAIHKTRPEAWLRDAAPEGARIGYDPWLHGKAEIDRIRTALGNTKAELVALEGNPLDACWTDRPPPPAGAVRIHPVDTAGEAAADKRARLATSLKAEGVATAVLSKPDSIAWLLNIRGSDIARSPVALGFAILRDDGLVRLFMDPDKIDGAVHAHLGNGVEVQTPDRLAAEVSQLEGPVLLDTSSCPLWFAERLEAAGTAIHWGDDPCLLPKARKNLSELAGMHAAHLRDGAAMARFLSGLDAALAAGEPLSEIDVAQRLEAERSADRLLQDISFDTISGAGPNGAIVHYRVTTETNRSITPGDILLIDSGGQYLDGTTDVTRTLATGPTSPEQRRHFTLVLKGMIAVSRLRWPAGLKGREIDPFARAALWQAGLDFDHGTGHGVGAYLNVHEGPQNLSRRGDRALEPGMILSNEPGCYVEGAYGIRIENLLIVTEPSVPEGGNRPMLGFETLTWAPIDRRLIEPELLEPSERGWLDAYHAGVLSRIGPALETPVREWLAAACAPL